MMTTASLIHDVELIDSMSFVPKLLEVVARSTGLRFAAIARVTDSHWMACAVHDEIQFGLRPGGELKLESTICNDIRQNHQPVIFGQASTHPIYSLHHTPKLYGFESYVSIPIFRQNGDFFGTLCALDPEPATFDEAAIVASMELNASLIAAHIDLTEQLGETRAALVDEKHMATIREQLLAVVGHDLRSPLHAATMGAELLLGREIEPSSMRYVRGIRESCGRMLEIIENVLDFARGRLGDGIPVSITDGGELQEELHKVVREVRQHHGDRTLDVRIDIDHAVPCDPPRIAQLFGNLLNNAVQHGATATPITVRTSTTAGVFELFVENTGTAIPPEKLAKLFLPFSHGSTGRPRAGLGLGLYIAAEIARAHGGELTAISSPQFTRFTLRMPCQHPPLASTVAVAAGHAGC